MKFSRSVCSGLSVRVGGARLEDAEHRDNEQGRLLQADADHGAWPDAAACQGIRELIRAAIQFAIGQIVLRLAHGDSALDSRGACASNRRWMNPAGC